MRGSGRLTHTSGEWLRGTGPESDIVISSRIRLARNLAEFPFPHRADDAVRSRDRNPAPRRTIQRPRIGRSNLLVLRRQHARTARPPVPRRTATHQPRARRERTARAASASAPQETVSLMINEEDHLRMQVLRSGFALDDCWKEINRIDDALEAAGQLRLQRAVRLPHRLPDERRHRHARQRDAAPAGARAHQGDPEGLPGAAEDQPRRPRPVRRRQPGDGRLLPDLQPGHARQERRADHQDDSATWCRTSSRTNAACGRRWSRRTARGCTTRCRGPSASCRTRRRSRSEETMHLLSSVRMGINLGLIDDIEIPTVNELFIHTQPAHLQKLRTRRWNRRSATWLAPRTCVRSSRGAGRWRIDARGVVWPPIMLARRALVAGGRGSTARP